MGQPSGQLAPPHGDFLWFRWPVIILSCNGRTMNIQDLLQANGFDPLRHLVALSIAYLLALPIGWNREQQERSAGLRTFPLVAVASCGFIQAAETVTHGDAEAMARIVEGIITGMGFIGGGAILRMKESVKGTATAASLWATGAIGTAVGLGSYDVALITSLVTIATLWTLSPLKRRLIQTREEEKRP
jgi:putative Mg2+ transporter-C (MgtC) family protein